MKSLLFKNSVVGIIRIILTTFLTLISVPVLITELGLEYYGIFSVLTIAGNLNTFTNFGLNSALVKSLAEQGKSQESDYDIIVTFFLIIIIVLILSLFLFFFQKFIFQNLLSIKSEFYEQSYHLFKWIILANIFLFIGQTFAAILDSMQFIYLKSINQFIYNVIYWGGLILVVSLDFHFFAIGLIIFTASFFWFLLNFFQARRVWGKINLTGIRTNYRRIFFKQINYALKIYAGGFIGFFYEPLTKILIGRFFDYSFTGYFDIGIKVKNQLMKLATALFYPFFPYFAYNKKEDVVYLLKDIQQKLFIFAIPLSIIILFTLKPFMVIWLGTFDYQISQTIIIISLSFLYCSFTIYPYYQFLLAKNKAHIIIILQLINVVSNLFLILLLINTFYYNAILISYGTSILISFCVALIYQKFSTNIIFPFNKSFSFKLLLIIFSLYVVNYPFYFLGSSSILLIIVPLVTTTVFIFLSRILNIFSKEDVERYTTENNVFHKLSLTLFVKK